MLAPLKTLDSSMRFSTYYLLCAFPLMLHRREGAVQQNGGVRTPEVGESKANLPLSNPQAHHGEESGQR